jgi:hypothetical protein
VQLANPRLRYLQHRTDLFQIQLVVVVHRHHEPLAFRQLPDRIRERLAETLLRGVLERIRASVLDPAQQRLVVAVAVIETRDPAARRVVSDLVVLVQRHTHLLRDLGVAGFAPELRLDLAHCRCSRPRLAMNRARRPIQFA